MLLVLTLFIWITGSYDKWFGLFPYTGHRQDLRSSPTIDAQALMDFSLAGFRKKSKAKV
jgi:F0F1-type ATP synthase membrane subunit a